MIKVASVTLAVMCTLTALPAHANKRSHLPMNANKLLHMLDAAKHAWLLHTNHAPSPDHGSLHMLHQQLVAAQEVRSD